MGKALAGFLAAMEPRPALLLTGPLGAGKTTLTRYMTQALPGGDQAEVSSPSFNLLNLYPTRPELAHFDFYRMHGAEPDQELLETLDNPALIRVAEWIDRLDMEYWPLPWMLLEMEGSGEARGARTTVKARNDGEEQALKLAWRASLDESGLGDIVADLARSSDVAAQTKSL